VFLVVKKSPQGTLRSTQESQGAERPILI